MIDTSKNQQAIKIIASEITKVAANTPMDWGTAGASQGMTKREGQAYSMAMQFVKMAGGKFGAGLYETWTTEERHSSEMAKEIAAAAIAITGK